MVCIIIFYLQDFCGVNKLSHLNPTCRRKMRVLNPLDRCMEFATLTFSLYVLMGMAAGKIVELDPDEKQWIQKKRGEARKQSETK